MAFFARPNLDDTQFKQLPESVLTLSGQTRIINVSGLTLKGDGGNIPIVVTGETEGYVLTYSEDENVIKLLKSSASGGSTVYKGASPTTCAVGGIPVNTAIYNFEVTRLLEMILVPTVNPVLVAPSSTFSVSPAGSLCEVGTVVNAIVSSTFSRGSVTPNYCCVDGDGSQYRSGAAICYNYIDYNGTPVKSSVSTSCALPAYTVAAASRCAYGSVSYAAGVTVKNSSGGTYVAALPSGTTTPIVSVITGIYPYFYGKVASGGVAAGVNRPSATAALVAGGTKVVGLSNGSIYINWNSGSDDYIWFAIPTTSASKTKWADTIVTVNNGSIGGAVSAGGNLFPDYNNVINVGTTCWSGQTYKVYISNYQTAATNQIVISNS